MTNKTSTGEFTNFWERLPGVLKALAFGIPAGYISDRLDTPIPWMIGPMIAVATLNLMGVRMHSPPYARHLGQVILGSAVSLYFTPTVMAALAGNFPAIVAATIAVFLIGALGALTLSRVSGVERKSTFFASIPGGAMAMAVLAERYGAQIAPVGVAHSLRVSVVVILIPFALTYGGIPLEAAAYRPVLPLNFAILLPWLSFSFLLGEVSERLRFHNGCLLMPIFFGAALTVSGIELSAVPHQLTDFAQLMFGLVLGARYERAFFPAIACSYRSHYSIRFSFSLPRRSRPSPRLGFLLTSRDDDHRHFPRRLGRDDYNCAGVADQCSVGGCVSLVSRSDG